MDFLESVILVSEKAANLARGIRQESHLFSLLVQEKKEGEKNPRFCRDFKTLADVLVQEVVKYELGKKFPDLQGHIHGEESNEFELSNGEIIKLNVNSSKKNTTELLNKVLNDEIASKMLAEIVHATLTLEDIPDKLVLPNNIPDIPLDKISIWIDPIDSTGEYVNGETKEASDLVVAGLPCVTVLIGAFIRETGEPVVGVINQPFHSCKKDDKWCGNITWGLNFNGTNASSILPTPSSSKIVVVSASEDEDIKRKILDSGLTIHEVAGAGYKLLCVIKGVACAYVLSKGTTFYWDTCGCDAVLRSLGGGILDYKKCITVPDLSATENKKVIYSDSEQNRCNQGGIIAYVDKQICDNVLIALTK